MKRVIVCVIAVCVILSGCAHLIPEETGDVTTPGPTMSPTPAPVLTSAPTLTPVPEKTPAVTDTDDTPAEAELDYSFYLGNWIDSDTALTRAEVFDQGGSAIQFEQIDRTHVVGNVISVSESPGHRDACVDFEGDIVGGMLDIVFDQDGWDNFGTISIQFETSQLIVHMESYETTDYSNWNIGFGDFVYLPEVMGS